jgi:hypothetical protein
MLEEMFYEFETIKVRRNGIVVFRRRWFHLQSTKIHASELCIRELPKRLSMFLQQYNTGFYNDYMDKFKERLAKILSMEVYDNPIDFLYREFSEFKWDINKSRHRALTCSRITLYRHFVQKVADLIPPNLSHLNSLNDFLWRIDKVIISTDKKLRNLIQNQNIFKFFYPEIFVPYKELKVA